ncbi:unnamed protein product [Brassica rapa subsp. trilocularis]
MEDAKTIASSAFFAHVLLPHVYSAVYFHRISSVFFVKSNNMIRSP